MTKFVISQKYLWKNAVKLSNQPWAGPQEGEPKINPKSPDQKSVGTISRHFPPPHLPPMYFTNASAADFTTDNYFLLHSSDPISENLIFFFKKGRTKFKHGNHPTSEEILICLCLRCCSNNPTLPFGTGSRSPTRRIWTLRNSTSPRSFSLSRKYIHGM